MNLEQALNSDSDFFMITTKVCYYCTRAKNILNAKGITFSEIDGNKELEVHLRVEEELFLSQEVLPWQAQPFLHLNSLE